MIAITGLRSGTSLMMQTLKLLGVEVAGFAFHDDFPVKELNPKGYWELPYNTFSNPEFWKDLKGKAVKLAGLTLLNIGHAQKVMWCRRNPEMCIKSILRLITLDSRYSSLEKTVESARMLYNLNNKYMYEYFEKNNTPRLDVYYEEMMLCPKTAIKKVASFLEIKTETKDAIKNVDKRGVLCQ